IHLTYTLIEARSCDPYFYLNLSPSASPPLSVQKEEEKVNYEMASSGESIGNNGVSFASEGKMEQDYTATKRDDQTVVNGKGSNADGSKSIITKEMAIKNKKKSRSVCEAPVSRPIEQLSSMLVHSLDHDEFRSVLSYVSKPRYSTMNTIKKFDCDARRMDGAGDKEVEDEEGKISVKTGLILREIQRVAEEKQRTEDIEADRHNSTVTAFIKESSGSKNIPGRLAECSDQDSSYSGTLLLNRIADDSTGPVTQTEQAQMTPLVVHTRRRSSGALVRSPEQTDTSGLYDGLEKRVTDSLDQAAQRPRTQNLSVASATAPPNNARGKGDRNAPSLLEDAGKAESTVTLQDGALIQMVHDKDISGTAKYTVTHSSNAANEAAGAFTPRLSSIATKPECTVIDIGDCSVEGKLERDVATNTTAASIAYIDDEEHAADVKGAVRVTMNKEATTFMPRNYTRGNIVHEMRALNEGDKEGVPNGESNNSSAVGTSSARSTMLNDGEKRQRNTAVDYDENSFAYTWGQFRVRNNKHGSYDMGNELTTSGVDERQVSEVTRGDSALDGSLMTSTRAPGECRVYPGVAFMHLYSATNAASALLEHSLQPARYDQREQYAKNYLQPTDNTLLSPNPASALGQQDNDMAILKTQQPDKCALAKKRKEKRRAKEQENVYVAESRDGYMGNLSPDEIVRRIEGDEKTEKTDEKSKSKGGQRSGNNNASSKDVSVPLHVVSKTNSAAKKKSDKERRHNGAEKTIISPKRSLDNGNVSSDAKMNGNGELRNSVDPFANTPSVVSSRIMPTNDDSVHSAGGGVSAKVGRSSEQSSEGDSGATAGGVDEEMPCDEVLDVDDEEQYMSADEGVNSAASDDVYHTDELSGTSGSRDLMSDAGNYRADDELVVPSSISPEEAEFIPVTARSRKKAAASAFGTDKRTFNTGVTERGGNIRSNFTRDGVRQRRNSAQLTVETGAPRIHHSPSPNERIKYSGPPTRRQLNSLADFIEDSTVVRAQSHKWAQHGGKWHGGATQSRAVGDRPPAPSSLHTSRAASPDRRASQPSCPISARYAAAVANNSHKVLSSDLTVYSTGSQGSFAKALLSPPLNDGNKFNNASSLRGGLHTSVSGSALSDSKKVALVYDPSDENANPPLPSTHRSPISLATMTNTAATHGNIPSRSWADIAKSSSRSSTCGTTSRTSDVISQPSPRDVSPEMTSPSSSTQQERTSSSASSINGSTEAPKESEPVASCSIAGDALTQIAGADEGVRLQGISFFYDPNEPASSFDQRNSIDFNATDLEDFSPSTPLATCPEGSAMFIDDSRLCKEESCSKSHRPSPQHETDHRSGTSGMGVVLKLEGGKKMTLPAMGTGELGGAILVEDRKHALLIEQLTHHWKMFEEHGSAPTRFVDIAKKRTTVAKKESC
uniref:Uncharacterized protein n=2 Tax=Parascaris univalens TaxID=6257 RepID=A0A915AVQ6_PARUN